MTIGVICAARPPRYGRPQSQGSDDKSVSYDTRKYEREEGRDKKIFLYTFQRYKNRIAGCLTQSHRKLKRERRKKYKPLRIRDTNKQKKREIKRQKLQRAAEKWSTPVKEASIVRP